MKKETIALHKKTIIIAVLLLLVLAGLITIGTLRLIARHNYDFFNLLPIIGKSLLAIFALSVLIFLFYLKKLISQKIILINKNLEAEKFPEISETIWCSLNIIAIYFFLSMTTRGDFHFVIPNEAELIGWAVISSAIISLIPMITIFTKSIWKGIKKKRIN